MKKGLIFSLILLLILGLMPTFADTTADVTSVNEDNVSSGEKLLEYGFISGNEKGLDEGANLTRAEMAVILADFYGLKEEAADYDEPANFTDVKGHWASSYIAFGQEKGWFSGYGDHSYRPDQTVSSKELAVYVLNVLGYNGDYTFDQAETFARDLDLVLDESDAILRGNAFDTIWSALHLKAKGDNVAIGVKLGKLPADTLATGAFGVEKAELVGLGQVLLELNQEMDLVYRSSDDYLSVLVNGEDLNRYDYMVYTGGKYPKVVFRDDVLNLNDQVTIKIDGLRNADGTEVISNWEKTFTAKDSTMPQVVKAEVVGAHNIRVTLSERIHEVANLESYFSINDDHIFIKEVQYDYMPSDYDLNVYYDITTYSEFKDGETVDLQIKAGLNDLAGYPLMTQTQSLEVKAETSAPVVEDYEARYSSDNSVYLTWSQPVEGNQSDYTNYIYHTNPSNGIVATQFYNLNRQYLYFDEKSPLPEGKAYIFIKEGAIKDLWGNENEEIILEIDVPVTKELEATKVTYKDDQTLEVTFNDTLDTQYIADTTELTSSNFVLKKDDKVIHNSVSVTYEYSHGAVLTLHYSRPLEVGDYTLTVKNVKNAAKKLMKEEYTFTFTASDTQAPEFPTSIMSKQENENEGTFYFIFNEEMALTGRYSILDLSKYTLTESFTDGSDYVFNFDKYADDISMEVINDGFGVAIHVSEDALNKMREDIASVLGEKHFKSSDFEIARVADAAGNVTTDISSGPITVTNDVTDIGIDIDKVEVTSENQAKVYFSDSFSTFEAKDITFTFYGLDLKVSGVDVETVDHKDVATYTFAMERRSSYKHVTLLEAGPRVFYGFDADTDGSDLKVAVTGHDVTENGVTKKVITSHNALGNYLAKGDTSLSNLVDSALIYDKTAPSVSMIDDDNDDSTAMVYETEIMTSSTTNSNIVARIVFTEKIDPASVSYGSFEAVGHTVTAIDVSYTFVDITIDAFKRDKNGDLIKDASGNNVADVFEVGDLIIQKAPISDMSRNQVEGLEIELSKRLIPID